MSSPAGDEQRRLLGPGARAIDAAVRTADGAAPTGRYHPQAPHRFRRPPLRQVTATRVDGASGHWHLVGYGLSELDVKESEEQAVSGWGFELTIRVAGTPGEPPMWAVDLLAGMAGYVWASRHPFAAGHHVDLGGPLCPRSGTRLTAAVVVEDPALGRMRGPFGELQFLQLVGVTAEELERCRSWSTAGVVELLARRSPLLVSDLDRTSPLDDPAVAAEVAARVAADGSALTELRVASLRWRRRLRGVVVEMGAGAAAALGPALRRELVADGARFRVSGDDATVAFVVGGSARWEVANGGLEVVVPLADVEATSALFDGRTGWGRRPAWPGLAWHVVP